MSALVEADLWLRASAGHCDVGHGRALPSRWFLVHYASLSHYRARVGGNGISRELRELIIEENSEARRHDESPWCTQEVVLVAKALSWSTAMLMAAIYLSGVKTISRLVILASAVMNVVVLASWRMWKRSIIERRVAAGIGIRNVLIVGAGKIGRELAESFDTNRHLGVVVKGFLDYNHAGDPRVLGRIENLPEVCRAHFVDEVIITIPFMRRRVRETFGFTAQFTAQSFPKVPKFTQNGAVLPVLSHCKCLCQSDLQGL